MKSSTFQRMQPKPGKHVFDSAVTLKINLIPLLQKKKNNKTLILL